MLKIKNLNKTFYKKNKPNQVLKDINLSIEENESVGLVGDSGCGKSTLLKCITGILPVDSGEILYKDKNIKEMNKLELKNFRKEVQFIFQNPIGALNPRLTIGQNIKETVRVHLNYSKKEMQEIIFEYLNKVGLDKNMYFRYPHELSGGQCQRAGIARALIMSPKLILADEPVSSLDVIIKKQIVDLLLSIKQEYNFSLFLVSHDLKLVEYMCDKVFVI
jgi:peptide/nickel transport system ATP-binding protein